MKEKIMKRTLFAVLMVVGMLVVGCNEKVEQGEVGRKKTVNGWEKKLLGIGSHNCWGRDEMYRADSTIAVYKEPMKILIGGKVNLDITVSITCRLDKSREDAVLMVFDDVMAGGEGSKDELCISHNSLYQKYVQPLAQSVPRTVFGSQTDVESVCANRATLVAETTKGIMEAVQGTPMKVTMVKVVNYDWPPSVTAAQERLATLKLKEEETAATIRARLKEAEGDLKIEEAKKLVTIKKAEAISESIQVIKTALKDCPEYLQWHTVKAMSEAATGPNNAFILFPYNMPGMDMKKSVSNVQLKQILDAKKPVKK